MNGKNPKPHVRPFGAVCLKGITGFNGMILLTHMRDDLFSYQASTEDSNSLFQYSKTFIYMNTQQHDIKVSQEVAVLLKVFSLKYLLSRSDTFHPQAYSNAFRLALDPKHLLLPLICNILKRDLTHKAVFKSYFKAKSESEQCYWHFKSFDYLKSSVYNSELNSTWF